MVGLLERYEWGRATRFDIPLLMRLKIVIVPLRRSLDETHYIY